MDIAGDTGLAVLGRMGGDVWPLFAMMIVVESAWFAVPHRPSVDVSRRRFTRM